MCIRDRGRGYHGIRDNSVYRQGLRLSADRDLKYAPVELDGISYLVNASGAIQRASSSSKSHTRPELGAGYKDVTAVSYTHLLRGFLKLLVRCKRARRCKAELLHFH